MFDQLSLLSQDSCPIADEDETTAEYKSDKRSVASEALVSLYKIEDTLLHKLYFGISDRPYTRFGDHKAGRHANAAFREALLERKEDFKFSVVCTFSVPDYCSKGNKSIAHAIESYAIAINDTLNTGYNKSYRFHHDFCDRIFWEPILPQEFQQSYKTADPHILNSNVLPFYKKTKIRRVRKIDKRVDPVACRLCRERLNMFKKMDIKVAKYARTLGQIDPGCYSRFMNGGTALGVPRARQLIALVEEHLGIADRFDFEKEYRKAIQINESSCAE